MVPFIDVQDGDGGPRTVQEAEEMVLWLEASS